MRQVTHKKKVTGNKWGTFHHGKVKSKVITPKKIVNFITLSILTSVAPSLSLLSFVKISSTQQRWARRMSGLKGLQKLQIITLSDGSFGKQVLDFTNRFEREHKASRKLRKMNALLQDLVLMWYHKI